MSSNYRFDGRSFVRNAKRKAESDAGRKVQRALDQLGESLKGLSLSAAKPQVAAEAETLGITFRDDADLTDWTQKLLNGDRIIAETEVRW